mmetsp:Transcript_20739/g.31388  ORF Transcript_20739/g.31388 Transcript_20739/m.31388 type:complete len:255 (-) Transcript_20739:716-1480(-)
MKQVLLIFAAIYVATICSFTAVPHQSTRNNFGLTSSSRLRLMLPDTSSILTSVEVFDGSTIVDPVVVSNVFWNSLKAKILALVIAQLLAAVAFVLLSSYFASQISTIGDFVSNYLFKDEGSNKDFIKATDLPSTRLSAVSPNFGKLLICLAIDVIGSSSEIVPILGELSDVVYAPIAAILLRSLYGGSNVVFALEFAEEILPFTDVLPLATICWVVDTFAGDSDLACLLQVGNYNSAKDLSAGAIDREPPIEKR